MSYHEAKIDVSRLSAPKEIHPGPVSVMEPVADRIERGQPVFNLTRSQANGLMRILKRRKVRCTRRVQPDKAYTVWALEDQ